MTELDIFNESLEDEVTCTWCNITVPRQEIGVHYSTSKHKNNVTKGCISRPVGNFCDGCPLLIMGDYDAFCKVGFAFRYTLPDGSPSFIYNLFRYYSEQPVRDMIGPAIDEMGVDEGDYDDWDIKAVKPASCKKYHPALYKKFDRATVVDKLIQGMDDLKLKQIIAEVEPSSSPLLNLQTLTFTRGKHSGIPIWNVAALDPGYLLYLCKESETDEDTITEIEDYIEKNLDQFNGIEI